MTMPFLSDKTVIVFDLDDTLYKEIDYLHSAYRRIADYLLAEQYADTDPYSMMVEWYHDGVNVFQTLTEYYGLNIPKELLLDIYRTHLPDISLEPATERLLADLSQAGYNLGIITDGRSITQRNKIKALGLERFIHEDCLVISEECGSEKPDEANYLVLQNLFSNRKFVYVGDNPKKDFITPKKLGWSTICLLDDGRNVHKQDFSLPWKYLPHISVNRIEKIINYI